MGSAYKESFVWHKYTSSKTNLKSQTPISEDEFCLSSFKKFPLLIMDENKTTNTETFTLHYFTLGFIFLLFNATSPQSLWLFSLFNK